jgi:hypothetical protein
MPATAPHTLNRYLQTPLRVGEPDVVGALAVFPVYAGPPQLEYRAFAQAVGHGLLIQEMPGGASVNDLFVVNAGEHSVLLYEGEEVLGAQQNRTFDVSALVAAGAKLQVPVSCVEQGRWDGSRHAEPFAPAPQAAYPDLRRAKSRQVREALAAGGPARASQGEVWQEVARKSERHGVASATGAMHDVFEGRRGRLEEMRAGVTVRPEQAGALVALGGRFTVLDFTSRADVFAALHGPLLQGYALDALEADPAPAPSLGAAEVFLETVCERPLSERDGIGVGREARFGDGALSATGLVAGDELIQLTAFAEEPGTDTARARIRRPSRRRG